ncbi:MAG TPA: ferritin-like domain-containing protein [Chitinophagaceae bacterium]|jgi:ferritin-like metal-binding protein YciE|nr:ferritin-like domain-containing protein [Chitinophagaceae bacterium]
MATLVNLRNLLEHEIEDLYSAEEQIIEALPKMAEAAGDRELKRTLKEHLRITKEQKKRLDQVKKILNKGSQEEGENKEGFFQRMFGSGGTKCKGMEGLIKEGDKILSEDMEPSVKNAAIIAASQKIEHYEISGYGTARAYAKELGLREVERLLAATLKEEYTADKMLNALALNKLNAKAERGAAKTATPRGSASSNEGGARSGKNTAAAAASSNGGGARSGRNTATGSASKGASKTANKKAATSRK